MLATIAVLAERAEVRTDGKLDVVGVYNCRYASVFPARLELILALRFDIEPLDFGLHQSIVIHVLDEDGGELVNMRATPVAFESPHAPGVPLAYDLIVPINISFPADGTWTFDVRVNQRSLARVPLRIERPAA